MTLTTEIAENPEDGSSCCYCEHHQSRDSLSYTITAAANWNGRFLQWGDGGKDGDLDFANHRLAQGYAVTNSNMGHDNGVEPVL